MALRLIASESHCSEQSDANVVLVSAVALGRMRTQRFSVPFAASMLPSGSRVLCPWLFTVAMVLSSDLGH